jgi:hypothetical protein
MSRRFLVGLDLADRHDYTAAVVIEQVGARPHAYHVLHLERWRGLGYPEITERLQGLLARPELAGQARLVCDATGVGAPVVDELRRRGLAPVGITIHGGDQVTTVSSVSFRVPKRDLVAAVQVPLEAGRLKIAKDLPLMPVLTEELRSFRVTIDPVTAHDSYAAWRERDHDDLVLALAVSSWYAEHRSRTSFCWAGQEDWQRERTQPVRDVPPSHRGGWVNCGGIER